MYGLTELFIHALGPIIRKQLCKKDVNSFIENCFDDPFGKPVVQQYFHKEWHQLISSSDRALIGAPRGCGKTIQIAGRATWELGNNPNLRIKIICAAEEKAREVLGIIRESIATNERITDIFPDLIIDTARGDTKGNFFVKRNVIQRDPSVDSAGVLAGGAGGRAEILICDDVVDAKNALTNPAMRTQVINALKETWFPLVSAQGKIIWICTPYHVLDATADLKSTPPVENPLTGEMTPIWNIWWEPAEKMITLKDENNNSILDEEGNTKQIKHILWPAMWGEAKLNQRRAEIGERAYARQYLLQVISDEERLFADIEKSYDPMLADFGEGILDDWPTFGGIDLASALGRKNAWTVIFTLALNPEDHRLYFKDMWRARAKFPVIVKEIQNQYRKHNWALAHVENNGFQQAVIDQLDEEWKFMPIKPFTTGRNKANEEIGLPGLSTAFSKGAFVIPAHRLPVAMDDESKLGIFMNELLAYPGGEFSDMIMACWFAWSAAKLGGSHFEDAYVEAIGMV